jgi:hypothetical protein
MVGEAVAMSPDLTLYAFAIRDRCAALGGDPIAHIDAALVAIGQGGLR